VRLANLAGRLVVVTDRGAVDVETSSQGCFGASPSEIYERWDEFLLWEQPADALAEPFDPRALLAPSPTPRQVFAIALNYQDHADETALTIPQTPAVFTKFPTSLMGPVGEITLVDGDVDWEVELVAVIGRTASHVPAERAWQHVAGLTIGQDISERRSQLDGPVPQFSLSKSFPGFAPTGPWLVTPDELVDRDDLQIGCSLNGEVVQGARTSDLIFSVSALVSRLSDVLPLTPGDLIFTGTPSGTGMGRSPRRFLQPGDHVISQIEGLGEMSHTFVRGAQAGSAPRESDATSAQTFAHQRGTSAMEPQGTSVYSGSN
jgi:2,4-diketo-3-deoxy-L-fuconate hydrolase